MPNQNCLFSSPGNLTAIYIDWPEEKDLELPPVLNTVELPIPAHVSVKLSSSFSSWNAKPNAW